MSSGIQIQKSSRSNATVIVIIHNKPPRSVSQDLISGAYINIGSSVILKGRRMRPNSVSGILAVLIATIIGTALCEPQLPNIFGSANIPIFSRMTQRDISRFPENIHPDFPPQPRRPNIDPPWRHHIDFEERHPGEDLLAVESSVFEPDFFQPQSRNRNYEPEEDSEPAELEPRRSGSGLAPSGPRRLVPFNFNFPSPLNPNIGLDENPLFAPFFGANPWWKGPNVCQRREEEDGTTEGNQDLRLEPLIAGNETESVNPAFHLKLSSCEEKETRHTCITHLLGANINRTIRTDYECCHGYLLNTLSRKCERGTLKDIFNTLADIGSKEFTRLVRSVGLDAKLERENLTLFVPTDDAIASYMASNRFDTNQIEVAVSLERETIRRRRSVLMHELANTEDSKPNSRVKRRVHKSGRDYERPSPERVADEYDDYNDPNAIDELDWRNNALEQHEAWGQARGREVSYTHENNRPDFQQVLLGHMIQGKLSTDDFVDEKVVYTENQEGVVRLNTWSVGGEKLKTVNCARLISVNHKCSNGMVHMIDRMIKPVQKSIGDIITSNPDLTLLKSLMSTSGLLSMLRDSKEHLTLFAPTNAALNQLGSEFLLKMRAGDSCLRRIMRNHLLPITLCSSVVFQQGEVRNVDETVLKVERTADDKLFINGKQIITRDIMTTNGVVHIIDGVLISDDDKPLASAMERANLNSFLELLSQVGMRSLLDDMRNVTIFAPSNKAIQALPQEVRYNPTRLREVLSYHIATPETKACHFTHGQSMPTRLESRSIRIDLYSMFPLKVGAEVTAQCGRITKSTSACNGIIYELDRVLIPSDMDVVQTLQTQADLSVFNRLIQEANLTGILKGAGPMTIFAPTDAAFYALPREEFQRILNDKEKSLSILKNHIVAKEALCCAGIPSNMWFLTKRTETLSGTHVPVYRDVKGQVMFGNAKVSVCDLTTSNNGVIHTVDSLLKTERDEDVENPNEFMGTCLPKPDDVQMMFFSF